MIVRRVVTGHDETGLSTIVSDESVDRIPVPGVGEIYRIWSMDEPRLYPDSGIDPNALTLYPPVGGLRVFVFTLEPSNVGILRADSTVRAALPDLEHVMADSSGLHQTDTTDFEVVLDGEATLETADGSKVVLKRGDTVIHNGASHRWSNQGSVPALLAGCMVGARREQK
jgi:mannose-6-phosphate isomerase-like protein (cupin superfamily)